MDRGVVPIFIYANDTARFFSRAHSSRLILKLHHSTLTSNTIDLEVGCITVRHFTILLDGKLLVGMQFSYLIADTVAHVLNRKDTCLMLVSTKGKVFGNVVTLLSRDMEAVVLWRRAEPVKNEKLVIAIVVDI